jgi:hypothetical protein
MADIIRFPGFLIVGRNAIQKDCKLYPNLKALIAELSEVDRTRAHRWLVKQQHGKSSYRAAVLAGHLPPKAEAGAA